MSDIVDSLSVATPRGPVAVYRRGSGPPLLLVAGLGSTARLWGELPRLLARKFTVLTIDNRGVGGSRDGEPFTLDGAVEDLAAVLTALAGAPAGVLGVSMGGTLACLLASRHSDKVSRLVAASCAARQTVSHSRVLSFFRSLLSRMSTQEAAQSLMTFAFAPSFTEAYPGFVDEAARLWAPEAADLPGTFAQIDALEAGFDVTADLARITAPTLILAGTHDPIVPATATATLARAVPSATYRPVAGAAHSVLAEGGAALLDEVISFLSAHDDSGGNGPRSASEAR